MIAHLTEEQLALYAGGDLDPSSESVLVQHLEQCNACQTAACEWTRALVYMAELRVEPLPEDLQQVRETVLKRLGVRRASHRRWIFAAAPAICGAVAAVFCWPLFHRSAATQRRAPIGLQVADQVLTAAPIARTYSWPPVERHHPRAGLRSAEMISAKNEPLVIRMTTADPSVVILLQTEERTDSNENN